MTDRELIEAAAKVAEIPGKWDERDDGWFVPDGNESCLWFSRWDPLNYDRHAFRLMVKLTIRLEFASGLLAIANSFHEDVRDHSGDLSAATRRAIVRAAAELGKQT